MIVEFHEVYYILTPSDQLGSFMLLMSILRLESLVHVLNKSLCILDFLCIVTTAYINITVHVSDMFNNLCTLNYVFLDFMNCLVIYHVVMNQGLQ